MDGPLDLIDSSVTFAKKGPNSWEGLAAVDAAKVLGDLESLRS